LIRTAYVQGVWLNYSICAWGEYVLWNEIRLRYDVIEPSNHRRCLMAIAVQQIRPLAHLPLVLGVLRRLEVATVVDGLIPPHPEHVLATGRGVEALVLAILDGDHALYKVGQRLDEWGMLDLLQPGLPRASLHDYRLGHIRDALFATNLTKVFSAIALKALQVYAIPTPWLPQDTTTIALYGAYADEATTPRAPRPAYGHSKDGRDRSATGTPQSWGERGWRHSPAAGSAGWQSQ
jgi:Domain of unknown function (DUF4277)